MNEISKNSRTIDTVTAEIILIRDNTARTIKNGIIEIGRRLEEAKEMVPQGEWLHYLQEVLGFKPSTAQNYMRIAREFGDGQIALDGMSANELFGDLGYSQLVPLLGLPEDDRREIAKQNPDLPDMSSREIKKLVEDYKAAENAKQHAEQKAAEAAEAAEKAEKKAADAEQAAADEVAAREAAEARADELDGQVLELMRKLREKPVEVESRVVPDEELLAQAREQVQKENEEIIQQAQERAEQASAALEKAKNPAVHQVNFLFNEIRSLTDRLNDAVVKLRAEQLETAEKFQSVIAKFFENEGSKYHE